MPKKEYYGAGKAQQVLGMSKATFHRKVKEGTIPSEEIPGMKQLRYPKADIDALARAITIAMEQHEYTHFSRSSLSEQEQEMEIGIRCFGGEYITPLPERISFQQKSGYTFWSLKVKGVVVGYVSLFHFPATFLDDLLTGRHIEREITTREVLPFPRLTPFDLYVDVMAVDPRLPAHLRELYAGLIVSYLCDELLHFLGNGFLIRTVYTVTATKEGDNLVRKLGFHLMEGRSQVPGRTAYEIILDEAGIDLLKERSRRGVYHAIDR